MSKKPKTVPAVSKLDISDHAVVRYMERLYGIDMDEIRAAIIGELAGREYVLDGTYTIPPANPFLDHHQIVIRYGIVKTVMVHQFTQ